MTPEPLTALVADGRPDTASAEDRWAPWALPQLFDALTIAAEITDDARRPVLATELYRRWCTPVVSPARTTGSALVGRYRSAHAGARRRTFVDGVWVLERSDVVGRDGWWRTWGSAWLPTRGRADSVRLMLTPAPDHVEDVVATVTAHLIGTDVPWLLAAPTDPRRLTRVASTVLYLPDAGAMPTALRDDLAPLLLPATPPLSLRLAPGIGLTDVPDSGMTFGEHRSHLVALALGGAPHRTPLAAIAEVFAANGIDPLHPYRS